MGELSGDLREHRRTFWRRAHREHKHLAAQREIEREERTARLLIGGDTCRRRDDRDREQLLQAAVDHFGLGALEQRAPAIHPALHAGTQERVGEPN